MKKILITLAIVALAPLIAAPAAEAGVFSVGVAFNVGGFFFDLGFGGPRYSAHASHHVYRVSEPFHYRGYQCHSGCYRTGGYSYHHANCPAVAYHFRSHGFSPYSAYPSFFEARGYYDRYYGYRGYRSHNYYRNYNNHYRYDRYRGHRGYRGHGNHGKRYYRHEGRRHHDRGHRGHDYQRDDRGRGDSPRYDRERSDHRRRGAASTRPPASRSPRSHGNVDRGQRGDSPERGRRDARHARPRSRQ